MNYNRFLTARSLREIYKPKKRIKKKVKKESTEVKGMEIKKGKHFWKVGGSI